MLLFLMIQQLSCYQLLYHYDISQEGVDQKSLSFTQSDGNLLFIFNLNQKAVPILSYTPLKTIELSLTNSYPFIQSAQTMFYDFQSIQTQNNVHVIELAMYNSVFYTIIGNASGTLDIYQKPQSQCVNDCQGFSIGQSLSKSYCDTRCKCQSGYFGYYCQFKRTKLHKNTHYEVEMGIRKWKYFSFKIEDEAKIYGYNITHPIMISFGYDGTNEHEIPGFSNNYLSSYLNLNQVIKIMKQQFPESKYLNVGLYSDVEQKITISIESSQSIKFFQGNFIFIGFTVLNLVIMLMCYGLTGLCKQDPTNTQRRIRRSRPKLLDMKPRQFSGVFVNKYFDTFDYDDAVQLFPQFASTTECVICMDQLKQKEVTITPCYHIFHHFCIKKWLMKQTDCPSCRFTFDYDEIVKKNWIQNQQSNESISINDQSTVTDIKMNEN